MEALLSLMLALKVLVSSPTAFIAIYGAQNMRSDFSDIVSRKEASHRMALEELPKHPISL